ncbi:recombination-associated protein RdgC [Marinobacterium aestuariivivens]|uniref:Recombination-associated protein RdgC n=1 Tax=Marinobacterium aestuariivivens TaxID=1698799 RepID=A0ABW2A848_9GAMM
MWFKNLIFYRLTSAFDRDAQSLETALAEHPFQPCGSQEMSRYGWIAPCKGLPDQLVYSCAGYYLICAQKEEKILPSGVIRETLEEKVEEIEHQQARKVYRRERNQLKDEIVLDLLPRAFTRRQQTWALIAPQAGWVLVDASAHKKAEELLTQLRSSLGTLPVVLPDVKQSPSAVMSHWLEQQQPLPTSLQLLDECEMKDNLVEGGVIRIKGQDLTSAEIVAHLEAGKRVTKLALEWDENLRFLLHEDLSIHRIKQTDQFREQQKDVADDELARFDADVAQIGLELSRLIPDLLQAFGGENSAT